MTKPFIATVAVCLLAAACSDNAEPSGEALQTAPTASESAKVDIVTELVERFETPACALASPVGSLKKRGPDGIEMIRAYSAKGDCLDELEQALPARGFDAQGQGGFIIGQGQAKTELVTIERAEGATNGGIQWEIVER